MPAAKCVVSALKLKPAWKLYCGQAVLTFDTGDYATNGVTVLNVSLGTQNILLSRIEPVVVGSVLYMFTHDKANQKVKVNKVVLNIANASTGDANVKHASGALTVVDNSGAAVVPIDMDEYANNTALPSNLVTTIEFVGWRKP